MIAWLPLALAAASLLPAPRGPVCVAVGGDVMHHRSQWRAAGGPDGRLDYGPQLAETAQLLAGTDLALVNLESPVDGVHEAFFFPRFSAPPALLEGLTEAGVDAISLANNHALDRGEEGLQRTVQAAADAGLAVVGVTPEHRCRRYAAIGVTVCAATRFLNPCCPCRTTPCPVTTGTRRPDAGLLAAISRAHGAGDRVVVLVHWGTEGRRYPLPEERRLAAAWVAAGAGAVLGTHSHVTGPGEWLPGPTGDPAWVRYGLGNLVSGMGPRTDGVVDRICWWGSASVVTTNGVSRPQ